MRIRIKQLMINGALDTAPLILIVQGSCKN